MITAGYLRQLLLQPAVLRVLTVCAPGYSVVPSSLHLSSSFSSFLAFGSCSSCFLLGIAGRMPLAMASRSEGMHVAGES